MGFFSESPTKNCPQKSHPQMFRPQMSECRTGKGGEYKRREEDLPKGTSPPRQKDVDEAFVLASSKRLQGKTVVLFLLWQWAANTLIPCSKSDTFLWFGKERRKGREGTSRQRGNASSLLCSVSSLTIRLREELMLGWVAPAFWVIWAWASVG
jgi:hypothetical protein